VEEAGPGVGAVEARWGEEALSGSYKAINEYIYLYLYLYLYICIQVYLYPDIHPYIYVCWCACACVLFVPCIVVHVS